MNFPITPFICQKFGRQRWRWRLWFAILRLDWVHRGSEFLVRYGCSFISLSILCIFKHDIGLSFVWLVGWLLGCSRTSRKNAGDCRAPVCDSPAWRSVSSLQLLVVVYFLQAAKCITSVYHVWMLFCLIFQYWFFFQDRSGWRPDTLASHQ